jgi:hypothetical protein
MYTRTAGVTKTASHAYKGRGLPFDQQTVRRRKKGECPLRLNERRWTARGISSRLRYDPARIADSAAEKANRAGRGEGRTAIVWVACPAGVVGANNHVTKAGTRDGFAIGSQHANAMGVARRTSAVSRKAKHANASRLPIRPR